MQISKVVGLEHHIQYVYVKELVWLWYNTDILHLPPHLEGSLESWATSLIKQ